MDRPWARTLPCLPITLASCRSTARPRSNSLPVRGDVPAWLNGTLLRTGPCKFEVGDRSYNHWFDGLAMLHRFTFADGQVSYANRFVRGHTFCEAERRGRISYAEFATDPCRTLFGKIAALFSSRLTDNCNINVSEFAGQVVALEEPALPIRFDPTTLETLGVYGYSDQIQGRISTAHPHRDTARQRHYSYMLQFGRKSTYRLFGIDSEAGRQEVIAELAVDRPAYMHSFGMSKQHLILTEFPLVVNPLRLRFSGRPFIENYRWEPERGLRFHIVEKDTGRVLAVATGDAGFAFHHVNAFEDGDDVVVDMVAYPDSHVIQDLYLSRLRAGEPVTVAGMLTRFRIVLKDGAVDRTELASEPLELRASTMRPLPADRTVSSGVQAFSRPVVFSTALSRSISSLERSRDGTSRAVILASQSSWLHRDRRSRMKVCSSR